LINGVQYTIKTKLMFDRYNYNERVLDNPVLINCYKKTISDELLRTTEVEMIDQKDKYRMCADSRNLKVAFFP